MTFIKKTYTDVYPKHVLNDDGTIGEEGFNVGLTQSWVTEYAPNDIPLFSVDVFVYDGKYHVRTWLLETLTTERVFDIENRALDYIARYIQVLSQVAYPG